MSEPSHLGSLFNLGSVVGLLPFPTAPPALIEPTVPCAVFTVFYIIDLLTPTAAIFCGAPGTGLECRSMRQKITEDGPPYYHWVKTRI